MTSLIVFCAKYLFALAPVLVVLTFWKLPSDKRRVLVIRALVVLALAVAFAKVGGALYNEPRPFVTLHLMPLIPHEADNGFPSDHTELTFACAFLLLPFSLPIAGIAGLVGLAVGAARIASLLHSPLDICAAIAFAALANVLAALVVRQRRVPEAAGVAP